MKKIALFGNPNTGKSSLFNRLTGLRQHIGNFPGVTVDKHSGYLTVSGTEIEIIDFPGTYSIYPRSKDEEVVYSVISDPTNKNFPEKVAVVLDSTNLERNLLLFTQIYDLGLPTALVLNMTDVASRNGFEINTGQLQEAFPEAKIIRTNARIGTGLPELKQWMAEDAVPREAFQVNSLKDKGDLAAQVQDTNERFERIKPLVSKVVSKKKQEESFSNKIDKWLVHPVFGYLIFLVLLLIIFQVVFTLASYPMDWIDLGTSSLASWLGEIMPEGIFTSLIVDGVIPGIGGVLIFIPQIGLLFFMLSILEETGYMARVVFITDKLMRPFGLNGKSVVPLLSSAACAIPGIMATRTISSWQERLTTILVAPLISCSARLPVYTLLISLVIPNKLVFNFLNLQGLVLFGLYLLGIISALLVAWVIKQFFKKKELSVFLLEMPAYKTPRWGNVGIEVFEKVKIFVFDAGKIILAISIILWALASFGPGDDMEKYAKEIPVPLAKTEEAITDYETRVASTKLEHSYMGHMGKFIEPVIEPLGYDWKMGISLLTSFAAREVFVGSLATIYSVHDVDDNPTQLMDKLKAQKRADGTPTYTLASGLSLLVFYVFAMQCMATLAVVKRETKSWKWPMVQLGYMGFLAYLGAYITYTLFK
ncbi:ferrous iron transport protein B [Fluviicola sp.]|uniref:ferrous iron transport protein B n=1 Tax=Fluviicola sp. TaxID=1917219 RepID=UPI0026312BCB|nr:ferrous iron transport protein B [Fluviicola sp.]